MEWLLQGVYKPFLRELRARDDFNNEDNPMNLATAKTLLLRFEKTTLENYGSYGSREGLKQTRGNSKIHLVEEEQKGSDDVVEQRARGQMVDGGAPCANRHAVHQVCSYFNTPGGCMHGDDCGYRVISPLRSV